MKMKAIFAGIAVLLFSGAASAQTSDAFGNGPLSDDYIYRVQPEGMIGTARTKLTNDLVQRSVERNNGQSYAGRASGPSFRERARNRQTCENGRRMQANGDGNPKLDQLARLCAQAGY